MNNENERELIKEQSLNKAKIQNSIERNRKFRFLGSRMINWICWGRLWIFISRFLTLFSNLSFVFLFSKSWDCHVFVFKPLFALYSRNPYLSIICNRRLRRNIVTYIQHICCSRFEKFSTFSFMPSLSKVWFFIVAPQCLH